MSIIEDLKDVDRSNKPHGFDDELVKLKEYYTDSSHGAITARLKELGVGLKNNAKPLQVSLLRSIVDRLAVVYDRSPTRWLEKNGKRLSENGSEHKLLESVLKSARYDLAWRKVDQMRTLMRQVAIRFYPVDSLGGVVMRCFDPFCVIRAPSSSVPDLMDEDEAFALRLDSGFRDKERWEMWEKSGGQWRVSYLDESGQRFGSNPFEEFEGLSPYSQLPVQMIYDSYTGGQAWLEPKVSRTAFVEAINAIANDIWALMVYEAHTETFITSDNPTKDTPKETGPGMIHGLPSGATMQKLSNNPKLQEGIELVDSTLRWWLMSEDLPVSEFDKNKQVLTGAARKVEMGPLIQRREALIPMAKEDERQAYRRFRAVHNLHAEASEAWTYGPLDESYELNVEIPETSIPTDPRELLDVIGRGVSVGTMSMIDAIQQTYNETRTEAISRYERISDDLEAYPPLAAGASEAQDDGAEPVGFESVEEKTPLAQGGQNSVVAGLARMPEA